MDAELLLYDGWGEDARGPDCLLGGPWSKLFQRIRDADASKTFPAARVSNTLTAYNFGGLTKSGKDYDQSILRDNVYFLSPTAMTCGSRGCIEIQEQVTKCLFSWWTDIPWMNLTVAGRMLEWLSTKGPMSRQSLVEWHPASGWHPANGWRNLSTGISFKRFEYVAYQQWCVLREGFRFRDVTNITGEAKWGSYMEDPLPGAKLNELHPLWISGQAAERVEHGVLPPLSAKRPPLLIFHADQGRSRAGREKNKAVWEVVLLELLKRHGRTDFNKDSIK
uniref:Uncharacterized protein n=1 Tax=Pyrodinium bahamense TaxID=73915 RepID=A0A7S0A1M6_9DINO